MNNYVYIYMYCSIYAYIYIIDIIYTYIYTLFYMCVYTHVFLYVFPSWQLAPRKRRRFLGLPVARPNTVEADLPGGLQRLPKSGVYMASVLGISMNMYICGFCIRNQYGLYIYTYVYIWLLYCFKIYSFIEPCWH